MFALGSFAILVAFLQTDRDQRYHFLTVERGEPVADEFAAADGFDYPL